MTEEKFWNILGTKKGFKGEWIHINLDQVQLPDKSVIEFEAIEFQRNGAGVVAENKNGEVILVKNYRYINDFYSWEVPAGTIPPGVDHSMCIIEELKEEAGCEVKKEAFKIYWKLLSFDRFEQSNISLLLCKECRADNN